MCVSQHGTVQAEIARCRIELEAARALVLKCAELIDKHGVKGARAFVSIIKVHRGGYFLIPSP